MVTSHYDFPVVQSRKGSEKMATIFITGSTGGLGSAIVEKFAENKDTLILHYYQNKTKALALKEEVEKKYQVKVFLVQADFTKEEEIEQMILTIKNNFSSLDTLINNAAFTFDCDFLDKTSDNIKKTFTVNFDAPLFLCKGLISLLKNSNNASIINISSNNALDCNYIESVDYDASKAALISLTHNLAAYLAPNIRVNAVCPGWINTKMNEDLSVDFIKQEQEKILLGRFAEPKEIAPLIFFLASQEASYMNDSIIRIDGGIRR